MSDYHALSHSERDFLVAVSNTPPEASGTELINYVQELHGGSRPSNTTAYNTLDELRSEGLIVIESDGVSNQYTLTTSGERVLLSGVEIIEP
jgi:DNA-binding PadR family transcriptional regulator